jgi:WD40 repeat protein
VEHILQSHQRAVSDLNWSPFRPELLATCSYDNYVHLWDLRLTGGSGGSNTFGTGAGGNGGASWDKEAKSKVKPALSFCSWTGKTK